MPNNPADRRAGASPVTQGNRIVRNVDLAESGTPPASSTPGTADQPSTIRETSGPTVLTVGAIADGEFLRRVGATVVGADPLAGGISGTVPLAKITPGGTDGSLTFTAGLLTAKVDPT